MSDGQVDLELSPARRQFGTRRVRDKARRVIPMVASALRILRDERLREDLDAHSVDRAPRETMQVRYDSGSRVPHDPIACLLSGPSRARQLRIEAARSAR